MLLVSSGLALLAGVGLGVASVGLIMLLVSSGLALLVGVRLGVTCTGLIMHLVSLVCFTV